jgi:hypothetical protein
LHYPIYDSQKKVVATNVTNLDVHDIARACRVYGVEKYFIIHPMEEQLMFVSRLLEHWRVGDGARFNAMRKTALTMVETATSLDDALRTWGADSQIVATHARALDGVSAITFRDLREKIAGSRAKVRAGDAAPRADQKQGSASDDEKLFILFGTGFGLTEDVMRRCTYLLEPIRGASVDDYRHLSVRSAVSICLDRLLGPW